ncbi:hypothetical protein C7T35_15995 [Variovorax sp. WS11]|nr:rubredoxin [Variovorax sp. WS11]PSL83617.1 hypothetical protein C7T35_15995 [Variovorax sp. WS11]
MRRACRRQCHAVRAAAGVGGARAVNTTIWQCFFCAHFYDEALGDPDHGIAPGTSWADVPEDWCCPECGATKSDFAPVEV